MKRNKPIFIFLIFAFGIPLPCSLLRGFCPLFQGGIGHLLLLGIASLAPTLAAILTVRISQGKNAVKEFLRIHYRENLSLKYCILAFIIPTLFLTIGKGIIYWLMPLNGGIKLPTIKKLIIILWALVAEELGWRGYLQEKVEEYIGRRFIPLVVGSIWALWHYHFWIVDGIEIPLVIFTYCCIFESYGYYMMTKLSKGNILPASIWHASSNLFFNIYLINPNWNNGSLKPYLIVNSIYTFYILIFFVMGRRFIRGGLRKDSAST
ncbi:MAG: CPBP family intramembrane metalloprotease [Cellulosilyticum sp.]|nr:CPBP family intramembrane metalloprotease [Cellulosilyticum sp.]